MSHFIAERKSLLHFGFERLLAFAYMPLFLSTIAHSQSLDITFDHVVGSNSQGDTVYCGRPLEFHLRMTSTYNIAVGQAGSGCGFKLYSPDGAIWSPINFDTAGIVGPGWKTMFDGLVDVGVASADGAGNDTGGFWGFSIFGSGLTMILTKCPG